MEIMFPLALFIGIPLAVLLIFFTFKRKDKFRKGKKVANTNFIEDTPLYKRLMISYRIFSTLALICLWLGIITGIVMIARPVEIDVIEPELQNRDIFICMDISSSVDELNLGICNEIEEVVKELDGERFGISIFNGRSVLLVPLTTDYDYVLDTLDTLQASFEFSLQDYNYDNLMANYDLYQFKYEGTFADEGSSFIGDGLASCLYNFPDLQENTDRSRLIIFATDNELNGTPLISVEDAAALCAKHDVKVFGVTPEDIVDEESFKKAMLSTGGGFYEVTSNKVFDKLIEDIRQTETSAMQEVKIVITDKPEALFICLLVSISLFFIFTRKVKL